jgi:hypothetical protein
VLTRDNIVSRVTAIMPFTGAATYYSRNSAGGKATNTYTSYSLKKVRPRGLTKKEVQINPERLKTVDKVFEIFSNDMQAAGLAAVKIGDYLMVEGVGWSVVDVTESLNGGCVNAMTKKRV